MPNEFDSNEYQKSVDMAWNAMVEAANVRFFDYVDSDDDRFDCVRPGHVSRVTVLS